MPRDSELPVAGDGDAHDIVSVAFLVISNVLGGVVYLASTEKLLGVAGGVEDDSEGGSHVDGLSSVIEVHVLSAVCTSVAVDIFELVVGIGSSGINGIH